MRRALGAVAAVALSLLSSAGMAGAQSGAAQAASGYLAFDHWAVQAAWRARDLGLVETLLPAQRHVSLAAVEAALREAAATETASANARALAAGWYSRLSEEFPGAVREAGGVVVQSAAIEAAAFAHTGRASPGLGEFPNHTGSEPLPDLEGVQGSTSIMAAVGRRVAVQLAPVVDPYGFRLSTADLTLAAGSWAAAIGRQRVGYGWGRGGGVVLTGGVPLDRIEVTTTRGIRLPGLLAGVGPVAFHTFLSRLPEDRHPGGPYFWGARAAVRPSRRIELAVQRAAMFGGSGTDQPITTRAVLRMLAGGLGGLGFENQIVSVAARYRLPTEGILPLTLYAEWGAEDAAGAWFDVPGYVVGLETPAVPGIPALFGGIEYASFDSSCCGNPPWYRHNAFVGSWATSTAPLGHPLGGNGSEILAHAGLDLFASRLRVEGRAFRRIREEENLFVPGRPEGASGFATDAAWRASRGSELYLTGAREQGDGWAEVSVRAGARVFLGR